MVTRNIIKGPERIDTPGYELKIICLYILYCRAMENSYPLDDYQVNNMDDEVDIMEVDPYEIQKIGQEEYDGHQDTRNVSGTTEFGELVKRVM